MPREARLPERFTIVVLKICADGVDTAVDILQQLAPRLAFDGRLTRVVSAVGVNPGRRLYNERKRDCLARIGRSLSLWVTEAGIFKDEDTSRGRKAGRIAAG